MKYISHLDLYRCFTRAIIRSGLNVWYTEGFNAHLYLSFPLALSLGQESICEIADIKLLQRESSIPERINAFLPFGLEVFNSAEAKLDPNDIGAARYIIEVDDGKVSPEQLLCAWRELMGRETITVEKRSKKGRVNCVDIKAEVKREHAFVSGDMFMIDAVVSAGNRKNLNPQMLLDELFRYIDHQADHWLIKRTQLLTEELVSFE